MHSPSADRPIGVFDSGVGGLSVLAALRAELPQEHFVYFSDAGHGPYGERNEAFVIERSRAITHRLIDTHGIKALVVACNTATAAAIARLREDWPQLPLIGVEPALKPAAAATHTGQIGVLATRGTLASAKFQALYERLAKRATFHLVACDGLADAIERGDAMQIDALAASYLRALGPLGTDQGQIDTLVLGCTHYPFVIGTLRRHAGLNVRFIDTGAPVALHTRHLLAARAALRAEDRKSAEQSAKIDAHQGLLALEGSGALDELHAAALRWLTPPAPL
ncbi:MAG: glutamate racemase [Burkholderiaceae bacterium]|jgi:glutamate racemase|nr:glutamate racemase [Burkholderiaceae bacterium]